MTNTRESVIETYLKDQIKLLGGLAYKFTSTVNGVPDQILIIDGNTYFVEVKRPGEVLRKNQEYVHEQFLKRGVPVYTVDSIQSINEFIKIFLDKDPVIPETKSFDSKNVKIRSKDAFKLD